jgi:hypothetical protein
MWLAYHRQDAEGAVVGMAEVVPLYRSPTLTESERGAVRYMIAAAKFGQRDEALTDEHAATLRKMLDRLSPPAT